MIKHDLKTTMEGRYRLQVRKNGEVKTDTGWFGNLILDNGLKEMASLGTTTGPNVPAPDEDYTAAHYLTNCYVGTSNLEPAVSQVELDGYLNWVRSSGGPIGVNTTDRYVYARPSYTFEDGSAAGNISEVGIGSLSNNLFSRALIRDSEGNPTTITVLSDEELVVTYELRFYQNTDTVFSDLVDGHTVTVKSCNVTEPPAEGSRDPRWYLTTEYLVGGARFERQFRARFSVYSSADYVLMAYPSATALGTISEEPQPDTKSWDEDLSAGSFHAITHSTPAQNADGTFSRTIDITVGTGDWNYPDGIPAIVTQIGPPAYQYLFDPPIMKTADDRLTLSFTFTWGRVA